MPRALISWSGGKDSALALRRARESGHEPVALLTTYNPIGDVVPIHDVPITWIERHSQALGIPLRAVPLPWPCSNAEYLRRVGEALRAAVEDGIDTIVFGDIHLADIRAFRERALDGSGLRPHFPLWGSDPAQLAGEIISAGILATITAVDPRRLDATFAGRRFDESFLADLPRDVDPCGENGEFHTAVWL